jgi:tetratricopeptide (TPR) repeat protein
MSFWLGLIVICLLVFLACDDESGVVPQPPQIDRNHELQRGWSLFRMKDYDAAAVHFDAVVEHFPDAADGYIGLGWCEIERDHLELALDHLQTADRLANEPDAIAGIAVAASALGLDSLAVEAASRCTDDSYLFIGDPDVGYTDLVYIRALGEFHLLRYEDCYASLRILDRNLEIDMEAYDFREQLFRELQRMRSRV